MRFVDYGNEEEYPTAICLKEIGSALVLCLPMQAVPCVLDGMEDIALDSEAIFNVGVWKLL